MRMNLAGVTLAVTSAHHHGLRFLLFLLLVAALVVVIVMLMKQRRRPRHLADDWTPPRSDRDATNGDPRR